MTKQTALAPKAQAVFLPAPQSFDEAYKIAQVLASSDLVPKDYKGKPENCLVAMQWGADVGLAGLQALQNIAVINGRPSIWGDAAKALVFAHPECEDVAESVTGDGDNIIATCVAKRKNKQAVTATFSVADAKKAGLWGKQGPWQNYPKRMLQLRARGFAIRDAFPDALRGLITAEEAQDMPTPEKDMGPADRIDTTTGEVFKQPVTTGGGLEGYTDEKIAANWATWQTAVDNGKSTDSIIANIQSRFYLSDAQANKIRTLQPAVDGSFVAAIEATEGAQNANA